MQFSIVVTIDAVPTHFVVGSCQTTPFASLASFVMSNHHSVLPTIRIGSQGLIVAYCQNLLNKRLPGSACWVDGIFGGETATKVRQFQGTRGIAVEGVVGPETWAALEAGPPAINLRPSILPATAEMTMDQYNAAMKSYNNDMNAWVGGGGSWPKPVPPKRPGI